MNFITCLKLCLLANLNKKSVKHHIERLQLSIVVPQWWHNFSHKFFFLWNWKVWMYIVRVCNSKNLKIFWLISVTNIWINPDNKSQIPVVTSHSYQHLGQQHIRGQKLLHVTYYSMYTRVKVKKKRINTSHRGRKETNTEREWEEYILAV